MRGSEIASNVGAGYDLFSRLEEMLVISGTPAQGHTVKELETAVYWFDRAIKANPNDQDARRIQARLQETLANAS